MNCAHAADLGEPFRDEDVLLADVLGAGRAHVGLAGAALPARVQLGHAVRQPEPGAAVARLLPRVGAGVRGDLEEGRDGYIINISINVTRNNTLLRTSQFPQP